MSEDVENHERIHGQQWMELLWLGFLTIYVAEFIVKFFITFSFYRAYRSISLEREAYRFDAYDRYILKRKPWRWARYVFSLWRWGDYW